MGFSATVESFSLRETGRSLRGVSPDDWLEIVKVSRTRVPATSETAFSIFRALSGRSQRDLEKLQLSAKVTVRAFSAEATILSLLPALARIESETFVRASVQISWALAAVKIPSLEALFGSSTEGSSAAAGGTAVSASPPATGADLGGCCDWFFTAAKRLPSADFFLPHSLLGCEPPPR